MDLLVVCFPISITCVELRGGKVVGQEIGQKSEARFEFAGVNQEGWPVGFMPCRTVEEFRRRTNSGRRDHGPVFPKHGRYSSIRAVDRSEFFNDDVNITITASGLGRRRGSCARMEHATFGCNETSKSKSKAAGGGARAT
jgi:hypothetical protein